MDDLNPILKTMMKTAGGSQRYAHESSLEEFIHQADNYQDLDRESLNQLYKFLIYNGGNGTFLTHPFPVERLRYLQEWANSAEYASIRQGNYQRVSSEGAVNVGVAEQEAEAEILRRQIEELQAEIERIRSQSSSRES
jgi:hypothetical protein